MFKDVFEEDFFGGGRFKTITLAVILITEYTCISSVFLTQVPKEGTCEFKNWKGLECYLYSDCVSKFPLARLFVH